MLRDTFFDFYSGYFYESAFILTLFFFFIVYIYKICEIPQFFTGNEALGKSILAACPSILQVVRPPFWCYNGTLQTILRAVLEKKKPINYRREIFPFSDGGCVALDWVESKTEISSFAPILVIITGITGSSKENYVTCMADTFTQHDFRVVVFNYRGKGGVDLKTPKSYSAAYVDDIHAVVLHIKATYPSSHVAAVGFSLGGMILYNYAAAYGSQSPLAAGVVISSAWNVWVSTHSLEQFPYRLLFNYRLAINLRRQIIQNRGVFKDWMDLQELDDCTTIRDFDRKVVVPMFGYKSLEEYYEDASIGKKIDRVKIPMLCIAAADDPFAPGHSLPIAGIQQSESTNMLLFKRGGHMGFLDGLWPFGHNYVEKIAAEFATFICTKYQTKSK